MEDYQKRYHPYEERFIRFSNFVEHFITRLIILLIILLILTQIALSFETPRRWLVPIEEIEGAMIWVNTVLL